MPPSVLAALLRSAGREFLEQIRRFTEAPLHRDLRFTKSAGVRFTPAVGHPHPRIVTVAGWDLRVSAGPGCAALPINVASASYSKSVRTAFSMSVRLNGLLNQRFPDSSRNVRDRGLTVSPVRKIMRWARLSSLS